MIRFKPEQQVHWYDVGRDELRTGKIYKAQIIESWNGDKLGYIVLTQDKCITEQRVTVLESQIGVVAHAGKNSKVPPLYPVVITRLSR